MVLELPAMTLEMVALSSAWYLTHGWSDCKDTLPTTMDCQSGQHSFCIFASATLAVMVNLGMHTPSVTTRCTRSY